MLLYVTDTHQRQIFSLHHFVTCQSRHLLCYLLLPDKRREEILQQSDKTCQLPPPGAHQSLSVWTDDCRRFEEQVPMEGRRDMWYFTSLLHTAVHWLTDWLTDRQTERHSDSFTDRTTRKRGGTATPKRGMRHARQAPSVSSLDEWYHLWCLTTTNVDGMGPRRIGRMIKQTWKGVQVHRRSRHNLQTCSYRFGIVD
jgi:hypothetical protein